jgi:diacylglycerol kinase family enzyme
VTTPQDTTNTTERAPRRSGSPRRRHLTNKRPPTVAEVKNASVHLIVNPSAGGAAGCLDGLTKMARERGIRVHVLKPGEDARLAAIAAAEGGSEVLGVAGGDGSVSAVAAVAAEHDVALVIVPVGTLNHFARDLGLDLARPLRALEALYAGHERRVDAGRINGHLFINNVSLGVYARMVGDPGYRQDKLRVAKMQLQAALSDQELRRVLRITPPEGPPLEGVLAVVVSNNPYEFARLDRLGQRHRLDAGMLQISVFDASTLDGLAERLLVGALSGAIEIRPALRHWMSERLEMGTPGERVRAGLDGEPITFEAPFRFSVEPGALRVLLPEGLPEDRRVPPPEAALRAARTVRQWLHPTLGEQEGGSYDPPRRMAQSTLRPSPRPRRAT